MIEIFAIGMNTFREAIRNKVLYLILFFMVLMLGSSLFLSTLALDASLRVIKNLGLSAINVFGLLVAMFIGVSLIPQEVESKTIYTIVSQGVRRWQFVLGKFLGLVLTVYANMLVMAVLLVALLLGVLQDAKDPSFPWVLAAVLMQLMEMLIIISIAILFSSFSTPILSSVLTAMVFLIGHMTNDFWDFIRLETEKRGPDFFVILMKGIWYLCPHLDTLNLKKQAVYYELLPAAQTSFPFAVGISHAIIYSSVVLLLACAAFSKRDF